ncbi:DNA adenine methylase [uncultured Duncaniella sp.]|uniref:DNA adenine methylase n=1 Tax=uncultured Duncaniella sp. TaxID=2768039 RepID=UPI0025A98AD7|nr:DNA adenine methylase [uncultured Duncaniella sp.]
MEKQYLSAPLPFVGQKRMFAKEYMKVLGMVKDAKVFVDLFGGSGLLSHITKRQRLDATVVYNDFDNYRRRIENIPRTNAMIDRLRDILASVPRLKIVPKPIRERVLGMMAEEEAQTGFVDYITLSTSLLFSMKYATTLEEMRRHTMYNRVRRSGYNADGYLDGIVVESCDYRELFEKYRDRDDVVFLVDPPYLSTEVGTYSIHWKLSDYLDVLKVLTGHRYVYFTSNKSQIIELCDWIGKNNWIGNPFIGATRKEFNASMNYSSHYTDIMLHNIA